MPFDPAHDRLWLVGDLVNRGPRSLDVLRWAVGLGDVATVVLGNHDLHLLAIAVGAREPRGGDTAQEVLAAPDRDELLDWLRRRPLLHIDGPMLLVHAGLHPAWTVAEAQRLAGEVEAAFAGDDWRERIAELYARKPRPWQADLHGKRRMRSIVSALVSIRGCNDFGELGKAVGPPEELPPGYRPWFDMPGRRHDRHCIVFGHWSTLGLRVTERMIALDTGCVWGGKLTAVRLDDRAVFQVDAVEPPAR